MVQGTTHQGINVRKTPQVSLNIDRAIGSGIAFEGELVTGLDGKQWIELSKLGGVSVSGLFIASWVVNYSTVTPPVTSEVPEWFDLTAPDGKVTRYTRQ